MPGIPPQAPTGLDLSYVVLLCDDVARMRGFYEGTLRLAVARDWDGWLELRAGEVLLALRPRGRSYDGPRSSPGAGVQLAFQVAPEAVNRWEAYLRAHGVPVVQPAEDQAYGQRTLFVRDPEGNVVEVYANL